MEDHGVDHHHLTDAVHAPGGAPPDRAPLEDDQADDGPLATHRLGADPNSAGAFQKIKLGDRTVFAVSDGFLSMSQEMIGTDDNRTAAYDELSAQYGEVHLPLGCFLVPGEQTVLIDTGYGRDDYLGKGTMVGGNLVPHLARLGYRPEDIDIVALSHLHGDHAGGLGTMGSGLPVFPNAKTVVGSDDWSYFVEGPGHANLADHTRAALESLMAEGKIDLVDGETQIVPGVQRLAAPGHTPGHGLYAISDHGDRLLLLGDAMYCPQQLSNLDWSVTFDVDPVLARRTRDALSRDLELHGGSALGCHFPGLIAGRALKSER